MRIDERQQKFVLVVRSASDMQMDELQLLLLTTLACASTRDERA